MICWPDHKRVYSILAGLLIGSTIGVGLIWLASADRVTELPTPSTAPPAATSPLKAWDLGNAGLGYWSAHGHWVLVEVKYDDKIHAFLGFDSGNSATPLTPVKFAERPDPTTPVATPLK